MHKGTIFYIGSFQLPDKSASAHRVLSNGKILRDLGYNVVFLHVDQELKYSNKSITKINIQGFETWSLPFPVTKKQWFHYLSNINFFIEIIGNYSDVEGVICYNYPAIALNKIKRYSKRNQIKVMADCTEWYSSKGSNLFTKIIKELDSFFRMKIIQKKLDGVITISSYLYNYYNDYTNTICIPPLVDLEEEKWNKEIPEYKDRTTRFIYAGSPGVADTKDKLNFIIEILYSLGKTKNYKFFVIGLTKEQYLSNQKNHQIIIKELDERVIFLGRLTHIESLDYVRSSDFTIFDREDTRKTKAGFPTKFVESISSGTPVITTKTSDLDKYLIEGENGFFIDNNNNKTNVLILEKVLEMNVEEIKRMKKVSLESKTFYYKNYINSMKCFLEKVLV